MAVNEHIFATVDGIIGTFAFGETYAAEQFKEQFVDVINETMDLLSSFSAEDFFPNTAGRLVDRLTGLVARREKIFKKLGGFFELVIEQYLDPTRSKPDDNCGSDLVQELIDLWKQNETTKLFTRDHVKGILLVIKLKRFISIAIYTRQECVCVCVCVHRYNHTVYPIETTS